MTVSVSRDKLQKGMVAFLFLTMHFFKTRHVFSVAIFCLHSAINKRVINKFAFKLQITNCLVKEENCM